MFLTTVAVRLAYCMPISTRQSHTSPHNTPFSPPGPPLFPLLPLSQPQQAFVLFPPSSWSVHIFGRDVVSKAVWSGAPPCNFPIILRRVLIDELEVSLVLTASG